MKERIMKMIKGYLTYFKWGRFLKGMRSQKQARINVENLKIASGL
jgi:hypothetical protein